jgi:hypothetical protein
LFPNARNFVGQRGGWGREYKGIAGSANDQKKYNLRIKTYSIITYVEMKNRVE